jgi:hypothetical protein
MEFTPTMAASLSAAIVMFWAVFSNDAFGENNSTDTSLIGFVIMIPIAVAVFVGIAFLVPILLGLLGIALIAAVIGGIVYAFVKILRSDAFKPFMQKLYDFCKAVLRKIGNMLFALGRMIGKGLKKLVSAIGKVLKRFATVLQKIFGKFGAWMRKVLQKIFKAIASVVRKALAVVKKALNAIWKLLTPLRKAVINAMKKVARALRKLVQKILRTVKNILRALLKKFPFIRKLGRLLSKLFTKIWKFAKGILKDIGNILKKLGKKFPILRTLGKLLSKPFSALWKLLKKLGNGVKTLFKGGLQNMLRSLKGSLKKILASVLNPAILRGIFRRVGKAVRAVGKGIWGTIKKVFHALKPMLKIIFWPLVLLVLLLRRRKRSSEEDEKDSKNQKQSEKVIYESATPAAVVAASNRDSEKSQKKDTVSTFATAKSQSKSEEQASNTQNMQSNTTEQKGKAYDQKDDTPENATSSPEHTKDESQKDAQNIVVLNNYSERKVIENEVRKSSATETSKPQAKENVLSRVETVAVAGAREDKHSMQNTFSTSEKKRRKRLFRLSKKDTASKNSEETDMPSGRKRVFARLVPSFARKKRVSSTAKKHTATKEQYTLPESLPLDLITMEETGESSSVSFTLGEVIDETRATAGINPYSEPLFR